MAHLLLLLFSAALAQNPQPTSVVVSGGAYLGLYEAGYLYVSGEAMQRGGSHAVRVATGASAGSANALVAALDGCLPPADRPSQDLGWQLWMDSGFDLLFDPDQVTPVSVFTQEPVLERLRVPLAQIWSDGLDPSCDVVVGIPVTRLYATEVQVGDHLSFPRQTLRFTFRIRGRGPGVPPEITNHVDPHHGAPQLLLPLTGEADDLDRLLAVITASGAFPYAFAPVRLQFCVTDPRADDVPACDRPSDEAWFIDGGVFDNIPLRLADRLVRTGLVDADPSEVRHLFIDPVIRAWPAGAAPAEPDIVDLAGYTAAFAGGFVEQARTNELYALVEEDPELVRDTFVALNRYPQASGFLKNFLGVFEVEFRRFDFYLGMYDAWADLPAFGADRDVLQALWDDPEWRPFTCMLGWYEPDRQALRATCDGDDLRDFRVLLQVSLDRLYSECATVDPRHVDPAVHHHCVGAALGVDPPRIVDGLSAEDALRRPDESALDHDLRLLAAYGFAFADLGLERHQGRRARRVLAGRLREATSSLSRAQRDPVQRRLVGLVGAEAVSTVHYASPPTWRYIEVGTVAEAGITARPTRAVPWLRWNAALQVDGPVSLLTGNAPEFSLRPVTGPDFELAPLSTRWVVPSVALRAGFQLGLGDAFTTEACEPDRAADDGRHCSQPLTQAVFTLAFLEATRLSVGVDLYPLRPSWEHRFWDVQLALGVQW